MPKKRLRILFVCSHPVQYASPAFREMMHHPEIEIMVAYCSLRGARTAFDPDFNTNVKWDIPLLDGYPWVELPNKGSGSNSFFGLWNPGLWPLIRQGNFDAVICHTGYLLASFWLSFFAAWRSGSVFLFGTDANSLASRESRSWKRLVKSLIWRRLFMLADQVLAPSTGTRKLLRSLGVPGDRITLTPYCVDNDWWELQSSKVDRSAIRKSWGLGAEARVVLFCGKLQDWKRPFDLLRAFASARLADVFLVFAGEGPLRPSLEAEAGTLGVREHVRFLGFANQSELPSIYTASDLLVVPSEYEPFAVVVNESSCCRCPVAASDKVGAAGDLIFPVNPAFVFPCGDTAALAKLLGDAFGHPNELVESGNRARQRMRSWSLKENITGVVDAVGSAVHRRNSARV